MDGLFDHTAFKREYILSNPVRMVRKLREDNITIRYLTADEECRLFEFSPSYLKPMIIVAIHTGVRKGELLALTWTDVDFEQRLLRVRAGKTRKTRYIPLNDVVLQVLDDEPRHHRSPYVFNNPETGTRWSDLKPVWYRHIVPALKRAGIEHLRFHDLRHTFASRLAQGGVPLNTIRELLGHGSMTMTLRYAHLAPNNLREAVEVLMPRKKPAGSGTSTVQEHPENRGAM